MSYATFHTQSFDGATPPALPSEWAAQATYNTTGAQSVSSPNSLHGAGLGGSLKSAWYTTDDGNNGHVRAQAAVRMDGGGSGNQIGVFGRGSNLETGSETCYFVQIRYNEGLKLLKRVNAVSTQLGSTVGSGATFSKGAWYTLILEINGTTLTAKVRRHSDSNYLDSSGVWQASEQTAITLEDSSISGAGFCGVNYFQQSTPAGDAYMDDALFERIVPEEAAEDGSAWLLLSRRRRRRVKG